MLQIIVYCHNPDMHFLVLFNKSSWSNLPSSIFQKNRLDLSLFIQTLHLGFKCYFIIENYFLGSIDMNYETKQFYKCNELGCEWKKYFTIM